MNPPITTVLFDVDGTLVDSNDAHTRAWVAALAEAGYEIPFATIRPLIGMGGDKVLPALSRDLSADREPGVTILARRKAIFLDREAAALQPTRGARDLVTRLRADGERCVVASSATNEELQPLLRAAGVDGCFDEKTTSADADASKPDPDIVLAALERSKVSASEAIMIGDTRFDVEAAGRAGVACIALRCGGASDEALRGALAVYDDPAALLDAYAAGEVMRDRSRRRS